MIYFDNSATGGFKPRAVTDAVHTVIRYLNANPSRSSHRLSITGAKTINDCRESLGEIFGASPDRVIFTKNCTEALNLAILGSAKTGGHVITTVYEHNSVLRPLFALKEKGLIDLDVVSPTPNHTLTQEIESKIKPNTYLIAVTSVSNVTGEQLPIDDISSIAKERNLLFLIDGAQGGGHIPLSIKDNSLSMLALAGHKGLYGIMGSGALIIGDNVELSPVIYGGTGSESFNLNQPNCYPERLESGTLNLPAITALGEGVRYAHKNLEHFGSILFNATTILIDGLQKIDNVRCFSIPNRSGICSFSIDNLPSADVSDLLNSEYDVAVRGGLHCAPLMHKFLGTEQDGLVRVSLAPQNTTAEINYFLSAIRKIASAKFS